MDEKSNARMRSRMDGMSNRTHKPGGTLAPVSLEPGATEDLWTTFLPVGDLLQWRSAKGYKAQATLGLVEVGFADGDRWLMTPPTDVVRENDVFHRSTPEVSRGLLSGPQHVGPTGAPCRDDRGLGFWLGALVRIKGETDAFAVCTKTGWTEQKSPNGEPRLWVSIAQTLDPEARAGAEVMPAPYSGSPYACMRATAITDRTGDRSKVCIRSWMEAGRARVIVFAARAAEGTGTQDLDTFLLAAGESHEVVGTARIGAVGMTVSAAASSRLKQ